MPFLVDRATRAQREIHSVELAIDTNALQELLPRCWIRPWLLKVCQGRLCMK